MNRKEALEQFKEESISVCKSLEKEFYQYFLQEKERFGEKLKEGFEEIVKLVLSREEIEIAYIQISYLRSAVLDGTYEWYIEAQDKEGVFDNVDRSITINMSEFFGLLQKLELELRKKVSKYAGKITEFDIEKIKITEFNTYISYFYLVALQSFQDIKNNIWYKKLKKSDMFRILLGEYKGVCQIIHITDNTITREQLIEALIAPQEEDALSKEVLSKRDFENLLLEEKKICLKNLSYSIFIKANIKNTTFLFCSMIGSNFSQTNIENSFFSACTFQNSSFKDTVIKRSGFIGSRFERSEYQEGPGLYSVSFQNANLEWVDFSGADLSGCDFRGTRLEHVIFSEAKLYKTIFDINTVKQLNLTQEQQKQIIIQDNKGNHNQNIGKKEEIESKITIRECKKYYAMSQDKRIRNKVILKDFQTDESIEFTKNDQEKLQAHTMLRTIEDENSIYPQMLEAPIMMVSEEVKNIVCMYDTSVITKKVSLSNLEKNTRKTYYILLLDRIDCLHKNTQFHEDENIKKNKNIPQMRLKENSDHTGKHVKKIVLDKEKIKGQEIFRIAGIAADTVVISMNIVESILRRDIEGICFEEIECNEKNN